MRKLKKTLFIVIGIIIIFVVVVILFISPITKYLIEKYDKKYTGREITLDWSYVNPFTGYIYLDNLKIHENKSDSIFFSANSISANFAMFKMLSKTYEISELTLNKPYSKIIQTEKNFNFNDLIEKFSSKENTDTSSAPVHFNILNISLIDGEFHYQDKLIPIYYFIKNVNIESSGLRWDSDTIPAQFYFLSGIGSGTWNGNITLNLKNMDYNLAVVINKFDLNILEQYVKDLMNYGSVTASLDADLKVNGNFTKAENVTFKGLLAINDFHIGENPKEDYAAFDKVSFQIFELSPINNKYLFDTVSLTHPYFKYERYDYLDNLQTMFGEKGTNVASVNADSSEFNLVIEIAQYINELSKNFLQSNYKINRLAITDGDMKFSDFSTCEKFSMDFNPLFVYADSVDKNHKRVDVAFNSGIKPYGDIAVSLSINPKDSGDFDLHYNLQKLPIAMFNPYTITYTSYPLDKGTVELKGKWNVRNSIIQSDNRLTIIDPRVSKRMKNKSSAWIPMPLIMTIVRERGNVIDYEIPITGNLKNPKFQIKDVIFDIVKNIFVKPATTAYRMQIKNIETEIEKSIAIKWQTRSNLLRPNQEKFIEIIAEYLTKNPEQFISVEPQYYTTKEKEYILFFEAKKKYFLEINNKTSKSFSENDSVWVNKMSVKDSLFVMHLNKHINNTNVFTIQDKCELFIKSAIINEKYEQLNKIRLQTFISYFKEIGVEKQLKIFKSKNIIPYNGFSFYKIEYKGELPESLIKAYQQMNEFNDEAPREKFKKERKKSIEMM
ncbi:MAG: hypothetical protein A2033_19650 [Bacteroidetes bacterium GWA2_31_9]|nr:MAG: hypothetical protein A2033_19650 [Bacteroidetes bacterium GWA2_31_9]